MKKNTYEELLQQRMREKNILKSLEESNKNDEMCSYSEEQILEAQKCKAQHQINELYDQKIFPTINTIIYCVYYISNLVILPMLYIKEDIAYVAVIAYFLILIILIVIYMVEKRIHKKMEIKSKFLVFLQKFVDDTSIFVYLLTSIGYMLIFMKKYIFLFIYISMLILSIIMFYADVIKTMVNDKNGKHNNQL